MGKRNKEPELLTDQEPEKKRGLLRVIELIDRDGGKFFKAGLLALPGMVLLFAAVQLALEFDRLAELERLSVKNVL